MGDQPEFYEIDSAVQAEISRTNGISRLTVSVQIQSRIDRVKILSMLFICKKYYRQILTGCSSCIVASGIRQLTIPINCNQKIKNFF